MERREFFRSLVAGGATVTTDLKGKSLKHRKADKAPNVILRRGPFEVPADVYEAIRESPDLHKTRKRRLAARYVDGADVTWLMMSAISVHRGMMGEICRTPEGRYRVHCWEIARDGGAPLRDARWYIEQDRMRHAAEMQAPPPQDRCWCGDIADPESNHPDHQHICRAHGTERWVDGEWVAWVEPSMTLPRITPPMAQPAPEWKMTLGDFE